MRWGLDLIALKTRKTTHRFKFNPAEKNYPVVSAFIHHGKAVVSGTNSGNICIWDIASGDYFQILGHNGT
jgi:WD40 repeat protein